MDFFLLLIFINLLGPSSLTHIVVKDKYSTFLKLSTTTFIHYMLYIPHLNHFYILISCIEYCK